MEITEEMVQNLMRIWPGKLPHKRAKKKLEWIAQHGCPLLDECLKCDRRAACPLLDGEDEE